MRILPAFTLFFLLFSCSNARKINFSEIDRLFIDYNQQHPNNYQSEIQARICIKTIYGEIIPLKNDIGFSHGGNVKISVKNETLQLTTQPVRFDDSLVLVDLQFANKTGEFVRNVDTLRLNFKAPIKISSGAETGGTGEQGTQGETALLFRYGKSGGDGQVGQKGQNGDTYLIRVWRKNDMYYIEVNNQTRGTLLPYQIRKENIFSLTSMGGQGGRGGTGGIGGAGKDGQTIFNKKLAGEGGSGGRGGNGGPGGDGGQITCLLHPNALPIRPFLSLISAGGPGGKSGEGGEGGQAGKPEEGDAQPPNGGKGGHGLKGSEGNTGSVSIQVESFEWE